jgi:predicted dehydrogenase
VTIEWKGETSIRREAADIGVALVGAGFIGGVHADAWSAIDGAQVRVVVDQDPVRAERLATRIGAVASTSLREALDRPDVVAVDVCLPTAHHSRAIAEAATAGKHILSEKPIALDLDEADRAIQTATDADVIFMVAHVVRFWPEYKRLLAITREGTLGPLLALSCSRLIQTPDWSYADWMRDPAVSRGVGPEVMIHDLDVTAALLGRPKSVSATGVQDHGGWSHLHTLLHYEQAVSVSLEAGWDAPDAQPFAAWFRAVFERGLVEYDSRRRPSLLVLEEAKTHKTATDEHDALSTGGPWQFEVEGYVNEIRYFVACVRGGDQPTLCPPDDARTALELALAVNQAATSGAEVSLAAASSEPIPGSAECAP